VIQKFVVYRAADRCGEKKAEANAPRLAKLLKRRGRSAPIAYAPSPTAATTC
jgi:hypothetical protein